MKVLKVIIAVFFTITIIIVVLIAYTATEAKKNELNYTEIRQYQIDKAEEIRKKQMEVLRNVHNLETIDTLGISDDLSDFEFVVEGDIYKFPLKTSDFLANGWELESESTKDRTLEPEETIMSLELKKGGKNFFIRLKNNTESTLKLIDANIFQITFYSVIPEEKNEILHPDIRLSQGIRLGSEEGLLVQAYGEPDEKKTEILQNDVVFLNYQYYIDDISSYKIQVDKYSSILTKIEITNRH